MEKSLTSLYFQPLALYGHNLEPSLMKVGIFLQRLYWVIWTCSYFSGRYAHQSFLEKKCLTQLKKEVQVFVVQLFGCLGK